MSKLSDLILGLFVGLCLLFVAVGLGFALVGIVLIFVEAV